MLAASLPLTLFSCIEQFLRNLKVGVVILLGMVGKGKIKMVLDLQTSF